MMTQRPLRVDRLSKYHSNTAENMKDLQSLNRWEARDTRIVLAFLNHSNLFLVLNKSLDI